MESNNLDLIYYLDFLNSKIPVFYNQYAGGFTFGWRVERLKEIREDNIVDYNSYVVFPKFATCDKKSLDVIEIIKLKDGLTESFIRRNSKNFSFKDYLHKIDNP